MRTPEAKRFLRDHYKNENTRQTSVMLLGPPGIGKSEAVLDVAEELSSDLKKELVDYTYKEGKRVLESDDNFFVFNSVPLVCHEPSDFSGIPREVENGEYVEFKPLTWGKVMSENSGILFLDDFLDVQRPDLFSVGYKLTLERRAGYYKLHNGVMVIAASNTPEYSSLSQGIPTPLANRMIILNIERSTVNEWANWMDGAFGNQWDKRTLAFLKRFEEEEFLMKVPEETEVLKNFPTPRTWTKASLELANGTHPEVIDGLLGPEVGQKFYAFTEVSVDVNELIGEPELWQEQNLDAKYMLCLELATWLTKAKKPERGYALLDVMKRESRQFPILTFLSMDVEKLGRLFNKLFRDDPTYSDLVSEVIRDRGKISL